MLWLTLRNSGSLQICRIAINRKCVPVNNLVTFSGKLIGFVEFFGQTVEALDVIINRRLKGRPRKRGK